jgi:hypothetical protein
MAQKHYYSIYHRESGLDLTLIGDYEGKDAEDAILRFKNSFGENYGRIVALPMMFRNKDYAFEVGKNE